MVEDAKYLNRLLDTTPDIVFRQLLNLMGIRGQRLTVMIFHRVMPVEDPLRVNEMHIERFEQQIKWISEFFNVLTLSEGIRQMSDGTLMPRSLCITFDDGYEDNILCALPILNKYQLPACFFITTAFLEGGMMWNDQLIESVRQWPNESMDLSDFGLTSLSTRSTEEKLNSIDSLIGHYKYMPNEKRNNEIGEIYKRSGCKISSLMMTPEQVMSLKNSGMEIGGHTHTHSILTAVDDVTAKQELQKNFDTLTDITGEKPLFFAYPNGKPDRDYAKRHVEMVRNVGYEASVTTSWGSASNTTDKYQIPRFTPWDSTRGKYLLRMSHNLTKDGQRCA